LRYTLHLGAVSREQCVALLSTYTNQVADTQNRLTQWHQATAQRLKISASEMRRKRDGIDGAIRFIPGLFKDDLNFRAIAENTAKMIKIQTAGRSDVCAYDTSDLYAEDVQLIAKERKIYYLSVIQILIIWSRKEVTYIMPMQNTLMNYLMSLGNTVI